MGAQDRVRGAAAALERLRSRETDAATALRLRLAQEAAQIGYWDYDLRTGEVVWDEACAAMFGITLAEFEGTIDGFAARCHPEDLDEVTRVLSAAAPGETIEVGYRALRPDGAQRHLLARGHAIAEDDSDAVSRIVGVVLDVTRVREVADAQRRAAERASGLASLAIALAGTQSLQELSDAVGAQGRALLGAHSSIVGERDDEAGVLRIALTDSLAHIRETTRELPLDSPLPGPVSARTGRAFLLGDLESALAMTEQMQQVVDRTGLQAWATVPLRLQDRLIGSLGLAWPEPRVYDDEDLDLLAAFAAQAAQALDRIRARETDRRRAEEAARLLETLHRNLLTDPPPDTGLDIVVRYQAAVSEAAVGGDWYDAFRLPGGGLYLVIGDCVGHDQTSAAAMAIARNVLRTVAYTMEGAGPAQVLEAYDRTVAGLDVPVLASALLARIEPRDDGGVLLRWSSAGHLPPVVRASDGHTEVLTTPADLLLGLTAGVSRTEHEQLLAPGTTLVLYTDGLVERRGEDIDRGLRRLGEHLADLGHLPVEQLCDAVITRQLEGATREDDIALLVARVDGGAPQDDGRRRWERVLELAPEPGSAAIARRELRGLLHDAGRPEWTEPAELAVSEVVTNGVLHARTPMVMTARIEDDRLRVEIRDHSSLPLLPAQPDTESTTGRGLAILDAVTAGHDVTPLGRDGKVVWFLVDDSVLAPRAEADLLAMWDDDPTD